VVLQVVPCGLDGFYWCPFWFVGFEASLGVCCAFTAAEALEMHWIDPDFEIRSAE